MRNFDNLTSYLDNDGNLLHGKIRFCRKGTTDNVIIYDQDETPLRNPAFTDMLGRTEHQVFLADEDDVTAYFYKYIGTGDMMRWDGEDYDPARWRMEYTSDSLDPVNTVEISSDTANGVATMNDLRAVDPAIVPSVNGKKLMWLYGYYNAGDKAPVLYVWDAAVNRGDDGGACIRPNTVPGVGRWILATPSKLFDVRHFGVFGQQDMNSTNFSFTSQLSNCATYCDRVGVDAWFPDLDNQVAYYLFDGSNTFSIQGDIWCSQAVVFMCKTGTTGTAIQCRELHKATAGLFDSTVQTGTATLTADWIRISWLGGNCVGNARVGWIIDSAEYPRIIEDKPVKFEVNGHPSLQLVNCTVESPAKISGAITMSYMDLHTDWFSDGYAWSNLSVGFGCSVKLMNCKDADTYVLLKNKLGQADYGDLGEQTLTDATLSAGAVAENFVGSVTLLGDAELHNASATVTISGQTPDLNFIDCWINISGSPTVNCLQLRRGSIGGTGTLTLLGDVVLHDSLVGIATDLRGGNLDMERCSLNAQMSHLGNPVGETVRDCTFNASLVLSGGATNSLVNAVWTGNFGAVADPIVINRANFDPDDSHHAYTYAGNTGTFPQRDHVVLAPATVINLSGITAASVQPYSYLSFSSGMNGDGVTDTSKYLCEFRMFSVGTQNVGRVVVTANPAGSYTHSNPSYKQLYPGAAMPSTADTVERTVAEWQSEAQVGFYFPRGLSFMDGYRWRITRLDNFWMGQVAEIPSDMKWSFIIDRV